MKRSVYFIAKMDCPTEEQLIRNRLQRVEGIEALTFNLLERDLTVDHHLANDGPIFTALVGLGMEPERKPAAPAPGARRTLLRVPGMCCPTEAELIRDMEDQRVGSSAGHDARGSHALDGVRPESMVPSWLPLALSGAAAAAAELLAWFSGSEHSAGVMGLAVCSILLSGRDTLRKGWVALRNRTLNINFLMTVAIAGALAIREWPEAAMVTFLFALAEKIEGYSMERARNAIRTLMELTPETATVRDEQGSWREVDAATVPIGRTVRVKPGERIPLDGTVTAGQSSVNQAPITGESLPVEKSPGDPVFAGSVNEHGSFEFEVTANKGNTTLDRIVRAVQEAQSKRAPTQRFVDGFARYYTPVVVGLAALVAALLPLAFGQPFVPWLYKALVLLVIACPCALVISTPVTVVSGLTAAARCGILVKGGVYLEEGRKLKVVALDKTGTLTHGKPVVTDVVPLTDLPADELLHLAASLNVHSEHPVAGAMVGHCATAHGNRPCILFPVTEFEAITGRGVRGKVNGRTHYVGSHRLTEENQVCGPHVEQALDRLEREGKTAVVLTNEQEALAVVGVADTLRETSVEAVRELHALGLRTVLLTGDNAATARAIAAQVGIDDVRGGLLPEDKLTAVDELRKQFGAVAMVGDGINDAPALAKASIGFAMGAAGTAAALETADVALMQDDLRKLPLFLHLSRRTTRVLTQNIQLAIGIKLVFFILALAGVATLWMAVFADMGASLLVVFNGLRLLRFGERSAP